MGVKGKPQAVDAVLNSSEFLFRAEQAVGVEDKRHVVLDAEVVAQVQVVQKRFAVCRRGEMKCRGENLIQDPDA